MFLWLWSFPAHINTNGKCHLLRKFALYGCETWSLTLRKEHTKLRVTESRVLKKIFGSKREEVVGGWRRLHNEELHNLYGKPTITRVIK
jgi:hypothetical protein